MRLIGLKGEANGIGGKTTTLGEVQVPSGIGGVNGILELLVLPDDVPCLVPVPLLKAMKMELSMPKMTAEWQAFKGAKSKIEELPSGHITIDIFEFAPGGWKPPRNKQRMVEGTTPDIAPTDFMEIVDEPSAFVQEVCVADQGALEQDIRQKIEKQSFPTTMVVSATVGGDAEFFSSAAA